MGCDIHAFVEVQVDGEWIMHSEIHYTAPGASRNYERFAAIAGVRGDGPKARGLPEDVSKSVRYRSEQYGSDGHSHSYLDLKIAAAIFAATNFGKMSSYEHENPIEHFFGHNASELTDPARLVFFFDN